MNDIRFALVALLGACSLGQAARMFKEGWGEPFAFALVALGFIATFTSGILFVKRQTGGKVE